jgi:hypothetical protein
MNEGSSYESSAVYDRALLLHGSKRNQVLSLAEIEQYGLDSFADADYISIYRMPPREWYRHGIRLLGRTAVECPVTCSAGESVDRPPLEGKCQYWHIALVETAQFFRILRD